MITTPVRGTYAIQVPAVISRRDILSKNWPRLRTQLLENVIDSYCDMIEMVERRVKSKKAVRLTR